MYSMKNRKLIWSITVTERSFSTLFIFLFSFLYKIKDFFSFSKVYHETYPLALVQCMYITYCTCIRLKPVLSELLSTGHRWAPIHVRHKKKSKAIPGYRQHILIQYSDIGFY